MKKIKQAMYRAVGIRSNAFGCNGNNEPWWRWVHYHNM